MSALAEVKEIQLQANLSALYGCFDHHELQMRMPQMRKSSPVSPHTQNNLYVSLLPLVQENHQLALRYAFLESRLEDMLAMRDRSFCSNIETNSIKFGSLELWYQQLKAYCSSIRGIVGAESLNELNLLERIVNEDQLCSNLQYQVSGAGEEQLSFTTRRRSFTHHIELRRHLKSNKVSVDGDTGLAGVTDLTNHFLSNGFPCDAFVRLGLWPLIESTVPVSAVHRLLH